MATKTATKSTKPAQKATKPAPEPEVEATEDEIFGVADVAALIKTDTGKEVKTRDLRTLLRKMARDGRLDREIVAGNRARWEFEGPEDPRVEAILEAYNNGELEADKQAKLQALKDRKAAQRAAKQAEANDDEVSDDDEELEEE